ncbi:hypothetical protein F3Y22_tig00009024pilonHSYRG00010 [Hibiscus syriacus]|uniref:Uncharacterized protein n=1 Tax=Hibiscus syriacus TaxID=106335 RepID=A0A6A3C8B0_HIBSY|nr:hypothetical protein F3Y22_tig00009024pilonHSYRG00010 [Hibiscus syriacus]
MNSPRNSSSFPSILSSIQHIPKHDIIKLVENTYLLWKHQVPLILDGYGLMKYISSDSVVPSEWITNDSGQVEENPTFVVSRQQDKLLASWLLTTISVDVLPHLTGLISSLTIWNAIARLFGAKSSAKITALRHSLHSQRKVGLSEQISVVLAGLSMEFESIIAIASPNMVVHSSDTRASDVPVKVSTDEEITEKQSSQVRGHQGNSYRGRGRGCFNGSNRPQDFTGVTNSESLHNDDVKKSLSTNADNLSSHSFSPRMQAYTHYMPSPYPTGFMYPSTLYPGTYATFTSLPVDTRFSNSLQNVSSPAFVSTLPAASSNVSSQSTPTNAIWYPVTGATLHVSNDLSVFDSGSTYTGNNTLLMGNGKGVSIAHIGQVLEFHPFECFVKDAQTQSILLRGKLTDEGLYQLLPSVEKEPRCLVNNVSRSQALLDLWHKRLDDKSPFEKLYQVLHDYSDLRIFGCACFPFLRPFNKHKLEFRSQQCVFLGYSSSHKGYKCLDENGRIFISRHVVFDEAIFPYNAKSNTANGISNRVLHEDLSTPNGVTSQRLTNTSSNHLIDNTAELPTAGSEPCTTELSTTASESDSCEELPEPTVSLDTTHVPSDVTLNVHPMVTRSKSGIWKPKLFQIACFDKEPHNIKEAFMSPHWKAATQKEYDALIQNKTWSLIPLPANMRAVPVVDFHEVFNPVVKPSTIHVILSLALTHGWMLRQVDINNAFLNVILTEEVYMLQPPGYELKNENTVCRLHKVIYGLKQALRAWFERLQVQTVINKLNKQFSLKDLGSLSYFLGVEVCYEAGGIVLSQRKYIMDLLQCSGFAGVRSLPTSMVTIDFGLCFSPSSKLTLTGFADANWGSYVDGRRSTFGYCVYFSGNLVSWSSHKQQVVARSTAEAEYRSVACVAADMRWLQSLLSELHVVLHGTPTLWCDNSSFVVVHEVPAIEQVADIFTKPLSAPLFLKHRLRLLIVQLKDKSLASELCSASASGSVDE